MSSCWPRILALLIASSWISFACSSAKKIDVGEACVLNSDCAKSLVCTWGKCHAVCKATADCPAGQSCVKTANNAMVCQLPVERYCAYNSDCQTPLTCAVDQRCHNQCQTSVDCIPGQICSDTKACAEPNQVDSQGRLFPATDGGVDGSTDAFGDAGPRGPNLDAGADRPADRSGETGGAGDRDGAPGAEISSSPTPDASANNPADVAGGTGGNGGTGGATSTQTIVNPGGAAGTAGGANATGGSGTGGVAGSGGTTGTGGSSSPPADAGVDSSAGANDDVPHESSDAGVNDSNPQLDAPKFITSLELSTTTISAGSGVTLTWAVGTGATYVSIDNGVGMKPLTGSLVVYPTQTTTYVLTATDGAGHFDTAQVTVTVVGGTGGTGGAGGSGGVGGTGGIGGVGGAGGTGGIDAAVDAFVPPPDSGLPQITNFAAGGTSLGGGTYAVYTGHATLLTATFSNATSAKVEPGFPSVTSGTPVGTEVLTATTTYTLTVSNAYGDSTAQIMVQVFPSPVTVASGQTSATGIAVDSSNIYWSTFNAVMKVSSDGSGTPVPLASGLGNVKAIALDADNVYWTDYINGTVMKVAKTGGDPPVPLASDQYYASAIAVDSSSVYWLAYSSGPPDGGMGASSPVNGTGTVMKVGLDGNGLTQLASGQSQPSAIAVDASNIYWTDYSDDLGGMIKRVAIGGGPSTNLAVGLFPFANSPLAVDANGVYWVSSKASQEGVVRLALTGGAPATIGASFGIPNGGLAIDDTNAYYSYGDIVAKAPLAGGARVILAFGQNSPVSLAVDATSVYWYSNGSIMKAPK